MSDWLVQVADRIFVIRAYTLMDALDSFARHRGDLIGDIDITRLRAS